MFDAQESEDAVNSKEAVETFMRIRWDCHALKNDSTAA